ncbi:MAG: hypothetical protein OXB86_04050 [Bdellovibrionales bacterium]|nr:hypothetical protein [Bdellovibrionales bacterium]
MSNKYLTVVKDQSSKSFHPKLLVSDFFFLANNKTIARKGCLTSVNFKGFTLQSHKNHLIIMEEGLLKAVLRQPIGFFLSEFEIELQGKVKGLYFLDNDYFEVSIGFLDDAPYFYRQCVADLLY